MDDGEGEDMGKAEALTHYYAWENSEKRKTLYRRQCRILARGKMNSVVIEFKNGQREVVSRNAVRLLSGGKKNAINRPTGNPKL